MNPDAFLSTTSILLGIGGASLLIVIIVQRASAGRAAKSQSGAVLRRANTVERMNSEIAARSRAEWNIKATDPVRKMAPPGSTKAKQDDAINEARRKALEQAKMEHDALATRGRKLTARELAVLWSHEAPHAMQAGAPEVSSDAYWKDEYHKHLARQQQKAAAAERRKQRQAEQQAIERRRRSGL